MSREWIYDNIFDLNEQDKKDIFDGIIEDRNKNSDLNKLKMEGNDPAEIWRTGEKDFGDSEEDGGNG